MLAVGFALVALGLKLVTASRLGIDGEECNPDATMCNLDNKVRNLERQMGHCIAQLTVLGEFKKKMTLEIALLVSELKDLRNNRPENVVLLDRPVSTSESISQNVTSLMNRIAAEEATIKKLSEEVAVLRSEKNRLKMDLETEKRYRRSLTDRLSNLDLELKESKSWKPVVEDMRVRIDNLTEPTQNLTVLLARLMEERDILKSELEKEKSILKNIEDHIYSLEKELNKTNNLKVNMEDLRGKMDQLKSNITNETVDMFEQIIEVKLANLEGANNEKLMEEKLKMLEYQLEDKQNNVSNQINRTLNSRVSKVEQMLTNLSSAQGNSNEKNSEFWQLEISEIKNAFNRSTQASENRILELESELEVVKRNVSALDSATSLSKEEIWEMGINQMRLDLQMASLNESQSKAKFELEDLHQELENLFEREKNISRNMTSLQNSWLNLSSYLLLERENTTNEWKEEISDLGRNHTILNERLASVIIQIDVELAELKEEMDQLRVSVVDLDHEWDRNLSAVNSRLKQVERVSSGFSGHLVRLLKAESALSKTVSKEDFIQHDEKIARLYVNVSKLRGQTEDFHKKLDTWNVKIAEAKNWVAEHVDREYKKLEKQINRANENLIQKLNQSVEESIEEAKTEIKTMLDKQEEHISTLLNQTGLHSWNNVSPFSVSNTSNFRDVCVPNLDWGSNLVVSYKSRPLTSQVKFLNDGEELAFRCSHIGRYVLVGCRNMECREGQWSCLPPVCRKLADEKDIHDFRDVIAFCQSTGSGHHLFPLDCRQYYNCMNTTNRIDSCSLGLFFDDESSSCVHREFSDCDDRPAIDFHPLPGTSDIPIGITQGGTLVVFPGQNLILNCIYPIENEKVKWKVRTRDVVKTALTTLYGDKNHRLELKNVSESNSGIYSCVIDDTNARNHSIHIQIKKVFCPEITVRSPLTIKNSVISTKLSSRIDFSCFGNHTLVGSHSITCQANGRWSDDIPTCNLKGCPRPDMTNDLWITLNPDQSFYFANTKVNVACEPGAPATNIPAIVRCLGNGTWSTSPFPSCLR